MTLEDPSNVMSLQEKYSDVVAERDQLQADLRDARATIEDMRADMQSDAEKERKTMQTLLCELADLVDLVNVYTSAEKSHQGQSGPTEDRQGEIGIELSQQNMLADIRARLLEILLMRDVKQQSATTHTQNNFNMFDVVSQREDESLPPLSVLETHTPAYLRVEKGQERLLRRGSVIISKSKSAPVD